MVLSISNNYFIKARSLFNKMVLKQYGISYGTSKFCYTVLSSFWQRSFTLLLPFEFLLFNLE